LKESAAEWSDIPLSINLLESRPTQRAPDPWESTRTIVVGVCAFSGSFLAQGWFRQIGVISSRPPAGTHRVLRNHTLLGCAAKKDFMPTEAHRNVLYREFSLVQYKELKPSPTNLLQEVVNFGTNAFIRCLTSVGEEENIHLAPLALYRQLLELTDGIEILVSNAAPSACFPLLRNSFEALLSLEFILEDSTTYQTRSLSWLASYARDTIRVYSSLLPRTKEGEKFLDAIKEDKFVRNFPLPPEDEVSNAINNLTHLLTRDQFKAIVLEYTRHKREPKWYALFGGPSKLRDLARHLRRTAQYDILYHGWSMSTHAQDFRPFLAPDETGQGAIQGLRNLSTTYEVTTFAVTFIIDATRLLINTLRPGENWSSWYSREVKDAYSQFAKISSH
jgi:hypothetical protein